MSQEHTFTVVQGDHWEFGATLRDKATQIVVDLTGATITGSVAADYGGTELLALTIGDGITVPAPTTGRFAVSKPVLTASFPAENYVYDFEVVISSVVRTRLRGTLQVLPEVNTP